MPTCKKCATHFPNRIQIDGEWRFLCSRKYCIACSPWGKHNTRKVEFERTPNRVCTDCKRDFVYIRRKGHHMDVCSSCVIRQRHRRQKRALVMEFGGRCIRCGYNKSFVALDFHHRDPDSKSFGIGHGYNRSMLALIEEAKKCDLLCSNCHREEHDKHTDD